MDQFDALHLLKALAVSNTVAVYTRLDDQPGLHYRHVGRIDTVTFEINVVDPETDEVTAVTPEMIEEFEVA